MIRRLGDDLNEIGEPSAVVSPGELPHVVSEQPE